MIMDSGVHVTQCFTNLATGI